MNHTAIAGLETWLSQQIIGQADLVKKLLIAILADGHLLVEGAPGLAKTRAIKMMAEGVEVIFTEYSSPLICCPAISPARTFSDLS